MIYEGIPCSSGIAIGKVHKYGKIKPDIDRSGIQVCEIEEEMEKLSESIMRTKSQLAGIREKAADVLGAEKAGVFDAHMAILDDPVFLNEINEYIYLERVNAGMAVEAVFNKYVSLFRSMEDEYYRERAADVADIGQRLLKNITGAGIEDIDGIEGSFIIVADEITPSDIALMIKRHVLGIAAGKGSRTSHAAIMARALHIPAVFGLGEAACQMDCNDYIIIDGFNGKVVTGPDAGQLEEYRHMADCSETCSSEYHPSACLPPVTKDGRCVKLYANIDAPDDIADMNKYGAEGIGLYRSEFLYSTCCKLPGEEEQFQVYKSAAERLYGKQMIIRTLDAGGDKRIPCLPLPDETNPFLGWRSIRISLEKHDIFKTQLRAVLRAAVYGDISLMYPMVSCISEIREANRLLAEVKKELEMEGVSFNPGIKTGIVVEVPSAAIMINLIVKEVDFVSIGTNDLCQYILAVDRTNPKVSGLHQPLHPAVLKLIKEVIDAANENGIPAALCGEMAADPASAFILLGLGLNEFSMNSSSIPQVKRIIRSVYFKQAEEAARHALKLSTAAEVVDYAVRILRELGL